MKVAKLTRKGLHNFKMEYMQQLWFWFKHKHLKISIRHVEGLEVCKAQVVTPNSYNLFYTNLQSFYNQHKYSSNHVWNYDETWIQVGRQFGAKVLARKRSNAIYNTIPKFQKWLTINCVVNVVKGVLLGFYIFRNERVRDDYIRLCKLCIYMAM
jgi:hypothetical protein